MLRLVTRELSLLELAVAAIVIGLLATVFLNRMSMLAVHAESTALAVRVSQLNTVLNIDLAERLLNGRRGGLADLEGSNPMAMPGSPNALYLGELTSPDPTLIDGGQWYFDATQRVLVYRIKNGAYFSTSLPGPKRARFKIRLRYDDKDRDGKYHAGTDVFRGARLERVDSYRWLLPGGDGKVSRLHGPGVVAREATGNGNAGS